MKQDKTRIHAFRLHPGDDLKESLQNFVQECQITSAWIVTAVGSLTQYLIRFANQKSPSHGVGHFEILSLAGTMGPAGLHLHICLANEEGQTIGGHLMEGCLVSTTVELVIQEGLGMRFGRSRDESTGWTELEISKT
jgi:predicted DNA-binding protein with PD1-like motif